MNILVYCWNSNSEPDILEAFKAAGHNTLCTCSELSSFEDVNDANKVFSVSLKNTGFKTDVIFSFDYFPAIAEYAHINNLPYISWIYDCPHLTVLSPTVCYQEVYLFLFDKYQLSMVQAIGAPNAFHLPLAVNIDKLNKLFNPEPIQYNHEVSFVGSLYNNNSFDKISYLPEELSGYLYGIMKSQQQLWGGDIISELITDEIVEKINRYVSIDLSGHYLYTKNLLYTHFLQTKVTSMDRQELLSSVQPDKLSLFTTPGLTLSSGVHSKGYVSYHEEMPQIFHNSKINLNITLRSITSGIPLRCIDIMGAGGFLLSNYQPELDEFFVNGEDYVYFEDKNDLQEKITYYLTHDEERTRIARNGHQKVASDFTYDKAISFMLSKLSNSESSLETVVENSITKQQNQPLFSIIIPCYNAVNYIHDCLNSLINQSIDKSEMQIILVDDCSTDKTVEILKEYEAEYPDLFTIILLDKNGRQGKARNIGIMYATGKYISFVDSDDLVIPDMYKILKNILKKDDLDVVQFKYQPFRNNVVPNIQTSDISSILSSDNLKIMDYASNRKDYLLKSSILNESCTQKIYKIELVNTADLKFMEGCAYEEPLFTYPIKYFVKKIAVLEKTLYLYRENTEGTTLKYMNTPNTIMDHITTQLALRDKIEKTPEADGYKDEADLYFLHSFYAEPFYFMKKRGWTMPVSLWRYLKKQVLLHVPLYENNIYLSDPSLKEEKLLFDLMAINEENDEKMQVIINSLVEKLSI